MAVADDRALDVAVTPMAVQQALIRTLEASAAVVERLSWNGVLRTADAAALRAEALAAREAMPEVFRRIPHPSRACGAPAEWLGLEPCLVEELSTDFLGMLQSATVEDAPAGTG